MDDDDFPDLPLDNFGAETDVAASSAGEAQTAPDANAAGSEATQEAQPAQADDNSKAGSNTSEQATSGDSGTEAGQQANEQDASQQTAGRPEKRDRVQDRFDEMTRKNYEQAAYIQKLERQTAQFEAMKQVQPLQPDENGMIDPQALQRHIAQTAQAQASAEVATLTNRLEREQIAQRINNEGAQIESRFKDLLESDPVHAETIKSLVEERINDNLYSAARLKDISPLKIAERYFAGVEAAAKKAQTQAQQNLQSLQAESAVNPTGSANTVDADSDEALEARLANVTF